MRSQISLSIVSSFRSACVSVLDLFTFCENILTCNGVGVGMFEKGEAWFVFGMGGSTCSMAWDSHGVLLRVLSELLSMSM